MNTTKNRFRLFEGVTPVWGKHTCALYDFDRARILTLSHAGYRALKLAGRYPIRRVSHEVGTGEREMRSYLGELAGQGCGFFSDSIQCFPSTVPDWYCSSTIQQAQIDYRGKRYPIGPVLHGLDKMLCRNLEIWVDGEDPESVDDLLGNTGNLSFQYVAVIAKGIRIAYARELMEKHGRLLDLTIYGRQHAGCLELRHGKRIMLLVDAPRVVSYASPKNIVINRQFFAESLLFNAYLNRRMAVDRDGHIRNALGFPIDYGNVRTRELESVAGDPRFQSMWHVNPDRIVGIRDDPFRYAKLITGVPMAVKGGSQYEIIGVRQH